MDDKLFSIYQKIRGELEYLVDQTSKKEVFKLLSEDFDVEVI